MKLNRLSARLDFVCELYDPEVRNTDATRHNHYDAIRIFPSAETKLYTSSHPTHTVSLMFGAWSSMTSPTSRFFWGSRVPAKSPNFLPFATHCATYKGREIVP